MTNVNVYRIKVTIYTLLELVMFIAEVGTIYHLMATLLEETLYYFFQTPTVNFCGETAFLVFWKIQFEVIQHQAGRWCPSLGEGAPP